MRESFVTPSTSSATSSPNSAAISSSVVSVSSTVSCSSAATITGVSARSSAQMRATPSGCTTYGSPGLAHLAGVPLGRERDGALDGARVGVVARRDAGRDELVDQGPELLVDADGGCVPESTSDLSWYRRPGRAL